MTVHAALGDPRRYRRQLERLHRKHLSGRHTYELRQSGVSLASLSLNQGMVTRLLARSVERGEYDLEPARIREIETDGKRRVVFAYRLTDLVVHGVVAEILDEAMAPQLSPALYSYRKGVSWWAAVSRLAAYVRAHRRSRPDPRTRGLHVIRRDVAAYTDSIPVGATSPLWPRLRDLLWPSAEPPAADWRLIERVVRPEAFVDDGVLFMPYRGVPTGQPISCVLFNFYLAEFDRAFDGIPGAFYARYCDDIVFAHPDAAVVRSADAEMTVRLARLSLGFNERKRRTLYLTAAGRPSPDWPECKPATAVPFLGCHVSGRGTVALSRPKVRRLLAELRSRAHRTARALVGADPERIGRTVCAVINRALQARTELTQQRSAALLRRAVTDRGHLRHLDHLIARIVLEAVTGSRGPHAFRAVPYRTMRTRWKLISLVHARDRWGRGRRPPSGTAADRMPRFPAPRV